MQNATPRRNRNDRKRREGAVMLIVMLIILAGTAASLMAVHASRMDLRAAMDNKRRIQTKYLADGAMLTTVAYIEVMGAEELIRQLNAVAADPPPHLEAFGDFPTLPGVAAPNAEDRHHAMRMGQLQHQAGQQPLVNQEWAPMQPPQGPDAFGSLGPYQEYQPDQYVVDLLDCAKVSAAGSPGEEAGSSSAIVFDCVVKGRASISPFGAHPGNAGQPSRQFTVAGDAYYQRIFASFHTVRARLLTPPKPTS